MKDRFFARHAGVTTSIIGAFVVAALVLPSCKTRSFSSGRLSTAPSDAEGVKTACMGIQGNGHLFASHLGTVIALFENSIDPKVILGGSSGSIVGSIARALMNNESIRRTRVDVRDANGELTELTYPQKAALILAASEDVMNGFLFLPGLDELASLDFFRYVYNFGINLKDGQLPASSHSKILNIEPTVGSAVLVTAFFQLWDFGPILRDSRLKLSSQQPSAQRLLDDYKERKAALFTAFSRYTKARSWTLAEIIGLIVDPRVINNPDREERLKLLKALFREDSTFVKERSGEADLGKHQAIMKSLFARPLLKLGSSVLELGNEGVKQLANLLQTNRDDETYRTFTNRILNGTFLLPNPYLIQEAYKGLVPDPTRIVDLDLMKDWTDNKGAGLAAILRPFKTPPGMIIHSTFLTGRPYWTKKGTGEEITSVAATTAAAGTAAPAPDEIDRVLAFDAFPGFENLYQGYIVGDDPAIFEGMKARRDAAWSTWLARDTKWPLPQGSGGDNFLQSAPFLLYNFASLADAQSAIAARHVSNLSDFPPRRTLPHSESLGDNGIEAFIDPNHILIFGQGEDDVQGDFRYRGLNFGIQASAGEPGAFRRYPIRWRARDIELNSYKREPAVDVSLERLQMKMVTGGKVPAPGFEDALVVPFGGWSENVPLASIAHLDQCRNADFFVSSAKNAPGNDFQSGALIAVLRGSNPIPKDLTGPMRRAVIDEAEGHFQRLTAAATFSRSRSKKWIHNDLNFDAPCSQGAKKLCSTKEIEVINGAITPGPWGESRLNLAVIGYQFTVTAIRPLMAAKGTSKTASIFAFGQDAESQVVADLRNWKSADGSIWARFLSAFEKTPAQKIKKYLDAIREGEPVPQN